MLRRLRTWLTRQDRINRTAVAVAALAVIVFGGYQVWTFTTTDRRLDDARAALDRRDYKIARSLLDECIALKPDNDEYHYLAARAARQAGDYRAADRLLKRAADLGWPEDAVAFERALLRAQTGDFRAVEPLLREFLRKGPPAEQADLVLEVIVPIYLREFDILAAVDLLDGWVTRRPDDLRLRVWQYEAAKWMRAHTRAADALRAAVALAPDDAALRLKLADQLVELHLGAEAKPHYEALLARDPARPEYRFGMARVERELGNTDQAIQVLDELLAADPANTAFLVQRGLAEQFAGRPEKALPWLRKAAEQNPYELDLLTNLAVCLEQCGRPDEAKQWRQKAAVVDADLKEMKRLFAEIMVRPWDHELWYQAGLLLARNGQEIEARKWFGSALRLKPDFAAAQKALDEIIAKQNPVPRRVP